MRDRKTKPIPNLTMAELVFASNDNAKDSNPTVVTELESFLDEFEVEIDLGPEVLGDDSVDDEPTREIDAETLTNLLRAVRS